MNNLDKLNLHERLQCVQKNIHQTCTQCGRKPEDVTLIAVSKTHPVSTIQEAYNLGIRAFGENKVQEILEKEAALPKDITWHMIGHLQRNKVKKIIDKVSLIHSVDSERLIETIESEAARLNRNVSGLLEVNVAKEESKHGFTLDEAMDLALKMDHYPHIRIKGLMTIAPFVDDPEENRGVFARLRKLSVDISEKKPHNVSMDVLSMGMSNDYQVAIEEGSTMVRVGTDIFGARNYALIT